MLQWWEGLVFGKQVLCCIAIPATLILILDVIIAFAGGGHGVNISDTSGLDLDVDAHHGLFDFMPDADLAHPVSDMGTLRLFSVQGMVAFLCVSGWSGFFLYDVMPVQAAIACAIVFGFVVMYVIAKCTQYLSKLNYNGTVELRNALGATGTVYLTVPERKSAMGKVNVTVQGQLMEFDAVSYGDEIPTGTRIRVVDLEDNCMVVEAEE